MRVDAASGRANRDCVQGHIKYPGEHPLEATLYYARLVLTATAPADVLAYHSQDARFPHDPTTDQLYTDQRFEAYRALGADAALSALSLRENAPGHTATGRPTSPEPPPPTPAERLADTLTEILAPPKRERRGRVIYRCFKVRPD